VKESGYQNKIIKNLEKEGFYVLKLIRTNKNGIPDLIAFKSNKVCLIECKIPKGKLSELQKYRLDELTSLGIDCFVSYGMDVKKWDNGQEMLEVL
jgi:Holliday junction resolvase